MKLLKQLLEMKGTDELLVYTPHADMKVPRFFIGNIDHDEFEYEFIDISEI